MAIWEIKNKRTGEHVGYDERTGLDVYYGTKRAAQEVIDTADDYCQQNLEVVRLK